MQPCSKEVLREISAARGYWTRLPDANRADFIFRMFEPDGQEALCCGNGLACIAGYIGQRHEQANVSILTEVPLQRPSTLRIGSVREGKTSWVDLGEPRRTPEELVRPGSTIPYTNHIELVEDIIVEFEPDTLAPHSQAQSLALSGYLAYSGEPHLVVYPDEVFPVPALADSLFELQPGEANKFEGADPQTNFGTNLINSIGLYLNTKCRKIFPAGVSVNFVCIHPDNTIEYRCFERGIDRETLACAYVSHHLRGLEERIIKVLPHRCRWYDPAARTQVSHGRTVRMLESSPTMLFKGEYLAIQQVFQSAEDTALRNRTESASTPSNKHAPNADLALATPAINFS